MARSTTKVLTGLSVAALAAAGVAAVVNSRRGRRLDQEQRAKLNELDARLKEAEESPSDRPPGSLGRILDNLQRKRGISAARLRRWIAGVKQGTLSPEQVSVAENDFDDLERESDQSGA